MPSRKAPEQWPCSSQKPSKLEVVFGRRDVDNNGARLGAVTESRGNRPKPGPGTV